MCGCGCNCNSIKTQVYMQYIGNYTYTVCSVRVVVICESHTVSDMYVLHTH